MGPLANPNPNPGDTWDPNFKKIKMLNIDKKYENNGVNIYKCE